MWDYIYINPFCSFSGGKSEKGCPIVTFPDSGIETEVTEEMYRDVATYLTSIPTSVTLYPLQP